MAAYAAMTRSWKWSSLRSVDILVCPADAPLNAIRLSVSSLGFKHPLKNPAKNHFRANAGARLNEVCCCASETFCGACIDKTYIRL
jgi:hypothetical protein